MTLKEYDGIIFVRQINIQLGRGCAIHNYLKTRLPESQESLKKGNIAEVIKKAFDYWVCIEQVHNCHHYN
ncbi:MAG: hypothetical protein K0R90_1638 [Oscillospiraceae bacterium]|nr:hypothetical protein [Oscillospiraceae bacterium]